MTDTAEPPRSPERHATLRPFDDIEVGETHDAGPIRVTREAIVAFAQMYDPQPFHLDEAAGAASLLGGLAASGWHTAAIGMRLLYEGFVGHVVSMGSPGLEEVRWLKPVRPGDTLRMVLKTTGVRPSATRPDRGFVALAMTLLDGVGDAVMVQRFTVIVGRRGARQTGTVNAPLRAELHEEMPSEADLGLTAFYDEVSTGHTSVLGTQEFTSDLITGFATLYDPQSFHLDPEAARDSHFGGLCASGWQTAAFWMKHYIAARNRSAAAREAAGLPVAVGGPSPGFTDLKWLRPVYAGQTIRYGLEVTGRRRASRSGWGMVCTLNTGHALDGTLVFSFNGRLLWPLAPPDGLA